MGMDTDTAWPLVVMRERVESVAGVNTVTCVAATGS